MVRLPVRIVVLVLVVPVRLVWDALVVCAKAVDRTVLRPFGRGLAWLWRTLVVAPLAWPGAISSWCLWRGSGAIWPGGTGACVVGAWPRRGAGVVRPGVVRVAVGGAVAVRAGAGRRGVAVAVAWLVRYLLVVPAQWLYAWCLTPVGRAASRGWRGRRRGGWPPGRAGLVRLLVWCGKALFVWPWVALWRYVLAPVGRGIARRGGVAVCGIWSWSPARWLYAYVLTPVGRGIAWLVRGVGTVLATLVRWILVVPVVALWRYVLAPVGARWSPR